MGAKNQKEKTYPGDTMAFPVLSVGYFRISA